MKMHHWQVPKIKVLILYLIWKNVNIRISLEWTNMNWMFMTLWTDLGWRGWWLSGSPTLFYPSACLSSCSPAPSAPWRHENEAGWSTGWNAGRERGGKKKKRRLRLMSEIQQITIRQQKKAWQSHFHSNFKIYKTTWDINITFFTFHLNRTRRTIRK